MRRSKRRFWTRLPSLLILFYFLALLGYSEAKLVYLHRREAVLRQELRHYQAEGRTLEKRVRLLHNQGYLVRLAEERFGLVDPGQIAYRER